jgi:uncharacterized protein (DUF433 family)
MARPYEKQERYYVEGSQTPVIRLWFLVVRAHESPEQILARFPSIPPAFILDALAFAYDNLDIVNAELEAQAVNQGQDDGTPWNVGASTLGGQLLLPFRRPRRARRA